MITAAIHYIASVSVFIVEYYRHTRMHFVQQLERYTLAIINECILFSFYLHAILFFTSVCLSCDLYQNGVTSY